MAKTEESCVSANAAEGRAIGRRLEEIAWALFLIMTGALWLAPATWFPEGSWLTGVGVILLGLNAARHFRGLKVSGFWLIVGLAALAGGIGHILGRDLPLVPIFLIGVGAALVIKTLAGKKESGGASGTV